LNWSAKGAPRFLPFLFAFRLINLYNSLTHYAKGTSFSSDCFFHIISSSFHSICYGSFHHSLTVLYTINHWFIFLVCGWFHTIFNFFSLLSFYITLYIRDFTLFFFIFVRLIEPEIVDAISPKLFFVPIIDFVRHYFQYLCWFLFLLLHKKFRFVGFSKKGIKPSLFGFPFGLSFIAD